MDQIIPLSSGRLCLLIHPHPTASHLLLNLAAHLAQRGPLTVLDGGNCFNIYRVAQALRRECANVRPALERIAFARAFTCFQMAALVSQVTAAAAPTLVLDFLSTFLDENVPLGERKRLLRGCLPSLRRRCQLAPTLVSIRQESPDFMNMLEEAADEIWRADLPAQAPIQLTLRGF